jgi:hypothetical protein
MQADHGYDTVGGNRYVQFIFNASLTLMILAGLFWFCYTIWGDVKDLRGVYSTGESVVFEKEIVCLSLIGRSGPFCLLRDLTGDFDLYEQVSH